MLLAKHMDRPRETRELLATLFAAPGAVPRRSTRGDDPAYARRERHERVALRAFLADLARRRLSLPGDPDRRHLAWTLKQVIGYVRTLAHLPFQNQIRSGSASATPASIALLAVAIIGAILTTVQAASLNATVLLLRLAAHRT